MGIIISDMDCALVDVSQSPHYFARQGRYASLEALYLRPCEVYLTIFYPIIYVQRCQAVEELAYGT